MAVWDIDAKNGGQLGKINTFRRLAPPIHLSDAEREIWLQLINDLPASSFTDSHTPLLELYCRHVVQASIINEMIINSPTTGELTDGMLFRYERLLKLLRAETSTANALARALRLTRQSLDQKTIALAYSENTLVNEKQTKKPWEK